jgi:hypothetical protein
LLKTGVQLAFSIGGAGGTGRISGADIMADKDMAFKRRQAGFSFESISG